MYSLRAAGDWLSLSPGGPTRRYRRLSLMVHLPASLNKQLLCFRSAEDIGSDGEPVIKNVIISPVSGSDCCASAIA